MYLPLAGLIALAAAGGYDLVRRRLASAATTRAANDRKLLAMLIALAMVAIAAASLVSARRLATYADTLTLWQDVLIHQPNNYVANYNLASHFYTAGRPEEALPYYERAVALRPDDLRALNSYGLALVRVGRTPEAIGQFEQIVRLYPAYFPAYAELAKAYIHENRLTDATVTANRALQLARAAGQTNAVAQIEAFLNEVRAKQAGRLQATPGPTSKTQ
jgi:tetratricopeptide (TPR) repeat protein